jgi:F-type H+-transporting ATPase subunit delta
MMRAASREALATLRASQDDVLGADASSASYTGLAEQLYSVSDLLVAYPQLRRTVGDPSTSPDARGELIGGLLAGKLDNPANEFVRAAVRLRWSSPWDLADALELSGNDALFAAAEVDGVLDDVEDELFRFERILDRESELATLLDERSVATDRRVALLGGVLGDKVRPATKALLEQAVRSERRRSLSFAIDELLSEAASRQARSVARVISAVPLTEAQETRLSAALGAMYGRTISLRTAVDPSVRGGLLIHVGNEVIDGSVATRLTEARAALAR